MKIKLPNASGSVRNGLLSETVSFFLFLILSFALVSPVSATLPSSELWREDLIKNVVGFGRNTTGGTGGTLCRVTNLNNSGTGSLRACAEAVGTSWIVFDVSGTINLSSQIFIRSNKTIDGRGQNIVISGYGLGVGQYTTTQGVAASNVIVHNITLDNASGIGGASMLVTEDARDVWLDHITCRNAADECFYFSSNGSDGRRGVPPHNITMSWSRCIGVFEPDHCILISDPTLPEDVAMTVTLHHNWYDGTYMRHPMARYAKVHAFNNYYDQTVLGVDAVTDVQFYSENEIFYKHGGGSTVLVKTWVGGTLGVVPGGDDPRGALNTKVVNPWLINGATVQQVNASSIFNPSSYYAYSADTANAALQTAIINNAGRQNVLPATSSSIPVPPTNLSVR